MPDNHDAPMRQGFRYPHLRASELLQFFAGLAPHLSQAKAVDLRFEVTSDLGLVPFLPHWNAPFRRFLFRLSGITIGRGGFIGMAGYMEDYLPQNVVIEDTATISFGVTFVAHGFKRDMTNDEKHIIIRKRAYVGAASVLLPGIEIGEAAVVGAGSVVTKDVPPGAIVAGAPARILRYKEGHEPQAPTDDSSTK